MWSSIKKPLIRKVVWLICFISSFVSSINIEIALSEELGSIFFEFFFFFLNKSYLYIIYTYHTIHIVLWKNGIPFYYYIV